MQRKPFELQSSFVGGGKFPVGGGKFPVGGGKFPAVGGRCVDGKGA